MRRALHHWHVVLDARGRPTQAVIEHEHQVVPGRRHVHRHEFGSVRQSLLEQGMGEAEAWRRAMELDGLPEGSLDLARPPRPSLDESAVGARLHPEVRRSLT